MRRRPTLAAIAALCSILVVVAGCGGDDDGADGAGTSTTADAADATSAPAATGGAVDCDAFTTAVGLVASLEEIAQGSREGQVVADGSLATSLEALASTAAGDEALTGALDTLGQVSFQVTEEGTGPSADDVDAALATIDAAWSTSCEAPVECPAPETLEAEGLQCDAEGHVTPLETDQGADPGSTVPECPDPAVLEAEGFSCDAEGDLVPLDEETVTECPSPETLEAEGFSCDSEGALTPIEPEAGTEAPVECPAPEVLEAEGYTCDAEGNLTAAE